MEEISPPPAVVVNADSTSSSTSPVMKPSPFLAPSGTSTSTTRSPYPGASPTPSLKRAREEDPESGDETVSDSESVILSRGDPNSSMVSTTSTTGKPKGRRRRVDGATVNSSTGDGLNANGKTKGKKKKKDPENLNQANKSMAVKMPSGLWDWEEELQEKLGRNPDGSKKTLDLNNWMVGPEDGQWSVEFMMKSKRFRFPKAASDLIRSSIQGAMLHQTVAELENSTQKSFCKVAVEALGHRDGEWPAEVSRVWTYKVYNYLLTNFRAMRDEILNHLKGEEEERSGIVATEKEDEEGSVRDEDGDEEMVDSPPPAALETANGTGALKTPTPTPSSAELDTNSTTAPASTPVPAPKPVIHGSCFTPVNATSSSSIFVPADLEPAKKKRRGRPPGSVNKVKSLPSLVPQPGQNFTGSLGRWTSTSTSTTPSSSALTGPALPAINTSTTPSSNSETNTPRTPRTPTSKSLESGIWDPWRDLEEEVLLDDMRKLLRKASPNVKKAVMREIQREVGDDV